MAKRQWEDLDRYEGLRTRRRWTSAEASRVLADFQQSGESMTAFVRRHGLALHRLHYWRERLEGQPSMAEGKGVRLVPAVIRPAPLLTVESRTTVSVCVVEGDVRVELSDPHGTDPQWVAAFPSTTRLSIASIEGRPQAGAAFFLSAHTLVVSAPRLLTPP